MGIIKLKKDKKRKELPVYNPKELYLLTTNIVSNYDDGKGFGPRYVEQYYLTKMKDNKYYEIFSNVEIKYEDDSTAGFICREFNTPMISKVEPFTEYVKDPNKKLTTEEIFYFITMINVQKIIKDSTKEN